MDYVPTGLLSNGLSISDVIVIEKSSNGDRKFTFYGWGNYFRRTLSKNLRDVTSQLFSLKGGGASDPKIPAPYYCIAEYNSIQNSLTEKMNLLYENVVDEKYNC